ncbi:MAG: pyridoxal phosphate-dependent aminotransferase [Betaproteobacteria bacterium]
MTPILDSKLPHVGTTIFTVMSALALEHKAVNLGQGFPDFACAPELVQHVTNAMLEGLNQYPSMLGVQELRVAVSKKIEALYHKTYDANSEITITAGATQAILSAILATVRAGDEVIVLEPCYDSYIPNIELSGGVVVPVPMKPGSFKVDFEAIQQAISPQTRAIIINSPHNPSATIWSAEDYQRLGQMLKDTSIFVISDEVYEHMVFAPNHHISAASFPLLAERAFIISSFGKTYHVTGWKVAYCAAPAALMVEFRKVHQFNVFTVNTPVQHALARYMQDPSPYLLLPAFYQRKRDLFRAGLAQTHFSLLPAQGSYFQCVRLDDLKVPERTLGESKFCEWLTSEIGVAAIPLSAFYRDGFDQGIVRFCFAKKDETLQLALERLAKL